MLLYRQVFIYKTLLSQILKFSGLQRLYNELPAIYLLLAAPISLFNAISHSLSFISVIVNLDFCSLNVYIMIDDCLIISA
jgi:hypothetical protein